MNSISKTFLVLCILFGSHFSHIDAQNIELQWGEKIKRATVANPLTGIIESSAQSITVFDEDDASYYAIRKWVSPSYNNNPLAPAPKREYYLDQFDLSHKLVKSTSLILKTPSGKVGKYEAVYSLGNKFVLFFSYWDKKLDQNILYAINLEKDGKQGTPFMVDKQMIPDGELGLFRFDRSSDSLSLLITILDGYSYQKKATRKLKFRVLNDNLESSWEKEVVLSNNDFFMKIKNCLFTDSRDIFLLYSYKENHREKSLYNIIAYNAATTALQDIKIGYSQTATLDEVNMFSGKKKDLLSLVGFSYADESVLSGVYSGSMNMQTFAIENEVVNPFDKDTIEKYFSKKVQTRAMGVRPKYSITDIIIKKDGSLLLITENRAKQGSSQTIQGVQYIDDFYAFLEFMIIKLTPDGKIEWTVDIPKYQHGLNDKAVFGSYLMDYDGENIYLLYNEDPQNILLNSKKGWRNEKGLVEELNLKKVHGGGLMKVKVSSNGIATRELYKDNAGKNDIIIRTVNARRMKDGRIWLVGEDKEMYMYGYLKLIDNLLK